LTKVICARCGKEFKCEGICPSFSLSPQNRCICLECRLKNFPYYSDNFYFFGKEYTKKCFNLSEEEISKLLIIYSL